MVLYIQKTVAMHQFKMHQWIQRACRECIKVALCEALWSSPAAADACCGCCCCCCCSGSRLWNKMHCCCRPYVTTTPPNCSILKPQKQRCLKPLQLLSLAAAAQTRSRGLSKECTFDFWRREKIAEPPLRLRPGLKNARVLKNRCRQAEAHQARGLLIVQTNLVEAAHGHAWICCASRNGFVWSGKHISFQHLDYWSLAKKRLAIERATAAQVGAMGFS